MYPEGRINTSSRSINCQTGGFLLRINYLSVNLKDLSFPWLFYGQFSDTGYLSGVVTPGAHEQVHIGSVHEV